MFSTLLHTTPKWNKCGFVMYTSEQRASLQRTWTIRSRDIISHDFWRLYYCQLNKYRSIISGSFLSFLLQRNIQSNILNRSVEFSAFSRWFFFQLIYRDGFVLVTLSYGYVNLVLFRMSKNYLYHFTFLFKGIVRQFWIYNIFMKGPSR